MPIRECLENADDETTTVITGPDQRPVRFLTYQESTAKTELSRLATDLRSGDSTDVARWREALVHLAEHRDAHARLWAVGQDASSASHWSELAPSVARALSLLRSHAEPAARQDSEVRVKAGPTPPREPAPPALDVAIVGMGCLLPGATEIRAYWENILGKRDLVREVPAAGLTRTTAPGTRCAAAGAVSWTTFPSIP
jgi:hypothetical protein